LGGKPRSKNVEKYQALITGLFGLFVYFAQYNKNNWLLFWSICIVLLWLVQFIQHVRRPTRRAGDTATPSDNATVLHK
jgi:phosphotransferase system  glucose/maltose/N-acetylglucosamine-specific IIC component